MPGFDPDKFLSETATPPAAAKGGDGGFSPDRFLAETDPAGSGEDSFDKWSKDEGVPALKKAGGYIMKGVNTLSRGVDSIAGAPVRAAIGKLQEGGGLGDAAAAYGHQFASDPDNAPTGKDIAAKAGLSTKDSIDTHIVMNPFAKSGSLKVSPAGLAGTVADVAMDPMTYLTEGAGKLASKIPRAMELAGDAASATARGTGKVAARVVGHVDPVNFEKYVANSDRIKQVGKLPKEDIKDAMDQAVKGVVGDRDLAQGRVDSIQSGLDAAYDAKHQELKGATTPLEQAKQFSGSLAQQKAYLGSLSEQADDALARSGATFQKNDLLRSIDRVGQSVGDHVIGDEASAAVQKLYQTRQRIADALPDQIDARTMRDVLKQIRKDTDFDMGSGEFNDTLNGMRKAFTGEISGALKNASPEYEAYMKRMSDLAQSLGDMNRYFGDDAKALGSLEAVRKGSSTQAQVIEDLLRRHATVNGDQGLIKRLDDLKANHGLLDRMKGGEDLRGHFFPGQVKALDEARADAKMASDVAEPVERLGENRTYGVVQNGMRDNNTGFLDRQSMDALQHASGTDFKQAIDDKHVYDSFGKDGTRGSRMTVLGGTAGTAIGGAIGGVPGATVGSFLGAGAGATLDKYGGVLARKGIDTSLAAKKTFDKMTQALSMNPAQLGKYGPALKQASIQGPRSLFVTHHLLLNNDPAYRLLMMGKPSAEGVPAE